MRFASIHKLTAYLMVATSFLPIALSQQVQWYYLAGFVVVALASWRYEPAPRESAAWARLWKAGTLAVFLVLVADFVAHRGSVVVGNLVLFVLFLLAHRLWSRRTSRDYLWIYALTFMMLVLGTILNSDLSYAACFVLYTTFSVWALILYHLRREMEENYLLKHADAEQSEKVEVARILNSRRIVGAPFLAGTTLVSFGAVLGAALVFFLFPRVGFGFFYGAGGPRLTLAGFADTVKLGQHGTIKDNPEVVMRVLLPGPPPADRPLRWRGSAFDRYRAGEWSHSEEAGEQRALLRVGSKHFLPGAHGRPRVQDLDGALRQEVFLEPLDSEVLFAADRPVAFDPTPGTVAAHAPMRIVSGPEGQVRGKRRTAGAVRYVAWSAVATPEPAALARLPDAPDDPRLARYLRLPPELPRRVIDLARSITVGRVGPWAKAVAIQQHLQREYTYATEDLTHQQGREPLDEFLFDTRRGHCEYFASAAAVLLRAVGVPTRNVNGFLGGAWNDYGKYLAVRQGDAHSWLEVYFVGAGWVPMDPTPPAGRGARVGASSWTEFVDNARLAWIRWVIEYDLAKQVEVARRIARVLSGKPLPSGYEGAREVLRRLAVPALIALAVAIALGALARPALGWLRRRGGRVAAAAAAHPMARLYRQMLGALARHGVFKRPGETPGEFARGLVARAHPAASRVARLTDAYYHYRFGGHVLEPATLHALRAEVTALRAEAGRRPEARSGASPP